jgi:hypothetical protein
MTEEITILDCRTCGITITESRERWVVTCFFDHEPSEVYGTFGSETEATDWAESGRVAWDACHVASVRSAE